jgi:hypothetical protein
MDDAQFALLGVVPGDVEGAVKEVTLRMTRAAEEDASFREMLAQLAAERGGIYATAVANIRPEKIRKSRDEDAATVSL